MRSMGLGKLFSAAEATNHRQRRIQADRIEWQKDGQKRMIASTQEKHGPDDSENAESARPRITEEDSCRRPVL